MANQADFAPTLGALKDLRPFVFWAQTTLPTVFDDSLSYYEVLTKLCKMVNTLLENEDTNAENIEALAAAYQELQDFTNNYFENLDVTQEINDKLDALVADGTIPSLVLDRADTILNTYLYGEDGESGVNKDIEDLIADANADIALALSNFATNSNQAISQFELNGRGAIEQFNSDADGALDGVPDLVEDWMDDHFTNPSSVVIDDTLTVSGAAADAYATGKLMDDAENMVLATAYWQNYMIDALSQYYILADNSGGSNPTVGQGAQYKVMHIANVTPGETYLVSGVASSFSGTRYIPAYALGSVTYDTGGNPYYEFYDVYPRGWDNSSDPGAVYQYVRNQTVRIPTGTSPVITHLFIMSDSRIPVTARCSRLNVRTDDTLTSESLPAEGKATGDALDTKVPWPIESGSKDVGAAGNKLISNGNGTVSWSEDNSSELEDIVYSNVLGNVKFEQGSISSVGTSTNSTTRLRTMLIPIKGLYKTVCANGGWLNWYAYNGARTFMSRNTEHKQEITPSDIDAEGAVFVRFVFGVDGNPAITPEDSETYSLALYTNKEYYNTSTEPLNYEILKGYLNENDELEGSFSYRFYFPENDVEYKTLSIRAKYIGESAPYLRIYHYTPDKYQISAMAPCNFIGKKEFVTQEFRIPNDYCITGIQINISVPEGSKLIISNCEIYSDSSVNKTYTGVNVYAHCGLDAIYPANSYDAFVNAGKCGFTHCITIPKFTADGVAVCFHNDGGASSPLSEQLTMPDGSAIAGLTVESKISDFTYDELLQWSIGASRHPIFSGCKLVTLDEFFGICSKMGMHPILSIHPKLSLEEWQEVKRLTDKWGLTKYLTVKSANYDEVWSGVINVFGDGAIEKIINIYSTTSTYDIVDRINTGKNAAGISITPVDAEFYISSLESANIGTIQTAQFNAALAAGFNVSVIMEPGTRTEKMEAYIKRGVYTFSNGRFVDCGHNW